MTTIRFVGGSGNNEGKRPLRNMVNIKEDKKRLLAERRGCPRTSSTACRHPAAKGGGG